MSLYLELIHSLYANKLVAYVITLTNVAKRDEF